MTYIIHAKVTSFHSQTGRTDFDENWYGDTLILESSQCPSHWLLSATITNKTWAEPRVKATFYIKIHMLIATLYKTGSMFPSNNDNITSLHLCVPHPFGPCWDFLVYVNCCYFWYITRFMVTWYIHDNISTKRRRLLRVIKSLASPWE